MDLDKLINTSNISIPKQALYDFIRLCPYPAHLKDSKTRKYIFSNEHNLRVYAADNLEKLIGNTIDDLDEFMRPYWGKDFAEYINEIDSEVISEETAQMIENIVFIDQQGVIRYEDMLKVPMLNSDNQVAFILTITFNLTHERDKFTIFKQYKKFFPKKSDACQRFMKYLDLNEKFESTLTEKEISVLLHMLTNRTHKYVAEKLNISTKTIETHVAHIVEKSKYDNISEIINFLRMTSDKIYN